MYKPLNFSTTALKAVRIFFILFSLCKPYSFIGLTKNILLRKGQYYNSFIFVLLSCLGYCKWVSSCIKTYFQIWSTHYELMIQYIFGVKRHCLPYANEYYFKFIIYENILYKNTQKLIAKQQKSFISYHSLSYILFNIMQIHKCT